MIIQLDKWIESNHLCISDIFKKYVLYGNYYVKNSMGIFSTLDYSELKYR